MTASRPLRAAVIGTGFVGRQHVDAIRRVGDAEVAVVAASTVVKATDAAAALHVAAGSGDWAAVVADPAIDVVHVCVPNDLHLPVARAALEAGKHVVSEKPLALNTAEGRQLVALAAASDRVAVLCHNYRFYALVAELRWRIANGELGRLHAVRGSYLQDWLIAASDTNWRVDERRGGPSRVIADIGTHWIDLAETVTGRQLEAVFATVDTVHPRRPATSGAETFSGGSDAVAAAPRDGGWRDVRTEDQAAILLRFAGGLSGSLVVSQVAAGHDNGLKLSVDGSDASATWQQESPDRLWLGRRDGRVETVARNAARLSPPARELVRLPPGHPEGWADAFRNLVAAAYGEMRGTTRAADSMPLPTFPDGLRHLAFVEAALESAATERWVSVAATTAAPDAKAVRAMP
ncbi:MAG: Gfo/Idh/MocA family protein [Chloroflexota bacterium]